jgi:Arc/MetJ-type ribon-helix-helix transcriptional regulator
MGGSQYITGAEFDTPEHRMELLEAAILGGFTGGIAGAGFGTAKKVLGPRAEGDPEDPNAIEKEVLDRAREGETRAYPEGTTDGTSVADVSRETFEDGAPVTITIDGEQIPGYIERTERIENSDGVIVPYIVVNTPGGIIDGPYDELRPTARIEEAVEPEPVEAEPLPDQQVVNGVPIPPAPPQTFAEQVNEGLRAQARPAQPGLEVPTYPEFDVTQSDRTQFPEIYGPQLPKRGQDGVYLTQDKFDDAGNQVVQIRKFSRGAWDKFIKAKVANPENNVSNLGQVVKTVPKARRGDFNFAFFDDKDLRTAADYNSTLNLLAPKTSGPRASKGRSRSGPRTLRQAISDRGGIALSSLEDLGLANTKRGEGEFRSLTRTGVYPQLQIQPGRGLAVDSMRELLASEGWAELGDMSPAEFGGYVDSFGDDFSPDDRHLQGPKGDSEQEQDMRRGIAAIEAKLAEYELKATYDQVLDMAADANFQTDPEVVEEAVDDFVEKQELLADLKGVIERNPEEAWPDIADADWEVFETAAGFRRGSLEEERDTYKRDVRDKLEEDIPFDLGTTESDSRDSQEFPGDVGTGQEASQEDSQAPESPTSEETDAGTQTVIPGAEKIADKELAERQMEGPKKATAPQKDMDVGMFDEAGRAQDEMFSLHNESLSEVHHDDETGAAVAKELEGKTFLEAVDWLVENAPDDMRADISRRIRTRTKNLVKHTGMKFEFRVVGKGDQAPPEFNSMPGLSGRAVIHAADFTSKVWLRGPNSGGRVGTNYQTALHEIIHAVTESALLLGKKFAASGTALGKNRDQLEAVTEAIHRRVKADAAKAKTNPSEAHEAIKWYVEEGANTFKNASEIVAWALSNKVVQNYLESIPYGGMIRESVPGTPKPLTMWDKLVQAVRRFFGSPAKLDPVYDIILRQQTAFDEVLSGAKGILGRSGATEKLISERLWPSSQAVPAKAPDQTELFESVVRGDAIVLSDNVVDPPVNGMPKSTPAAHVKKFLGKVADDYMDDARKMVQGDKKQILKNFKQAAKHPNPAEPGVTVEYPTTNTDASAVTAPLMPAGAIFKKHSFKKGDLDFSRGPKALYGVWLRAQVTFQNMQRYMNAFQKDFSGFVKLVKDAESRETLTTLLFLGDHAEMEFSLDQLRKGYIMEGKEKVELLEGGAIPSENVIEAYKGIRRLLDKIRRMLNQHERSQMPKLRARKVQLIEMMGRAKDMKDSTFQTLVNDILRLRDKFNKAEYDETTGDPLVLMAEIKELEKKLFGKINKGRKVDDPISNFELQYLEVVDIDRRLNRTEIGKNKGYFPHKFFGSWIVYREIERVDEDGETVQALQLMPHMDDEIDGKAGQGFYENRSAAIKAANALSKKNPEWKLRVMPRAPKFANSSAMNMSDGAYHKLMEGISDGLGISIEDAQQFSTDAAAIASRRRSAGFKKHRKGVEGFSEDVVKVMGAHFQETLRYMALDKIKLQAVVTSERLGLSPYSRNNTQPVLTSITEAWIRDVMGNPQPIEQRVDELFDKEWATPLRAAMASGTAAFFVSGGVSANPMIGALIGSYVGYRVYQGASQGEAVSRNITGAMLGDMAHLKLGSFFNVFSATVNLSQIPINLYPVLGAKDTGAGLKRFAAAVKNGRNYKDVPVADRTQAHQDMQALEHANVDTQYKYSEQNPNIFDEESVWSKRSMFLFNKAELANRGVSYLGALNKAEREGMNRTKAKAYAASVMTRTQHDYSNLSKPQVLRNTFLRVPLQFKNFLAQQFTFVLGLNYTNSAGNLSVNSELGRFMFSMFLMAGALGLPGLDLLDRLIVALFGEEASPIAKIKGEKFMPLSFTDLKGPWFSTMEKSVIFGENNATHVDQIRNLSSGIGAPLKWLETAANGVPLIETAVFNLDPGKIIENLGDGIAVQTSPWQRGRVEYNPTPFENLLKAGGGMPIRETRLRDARGLIQAKTENYTVKRRRALDGIVKATSTGNYAKITRIRQEAANDGIVIDRKAIEKALKTANMDRMGRLISRTPKTLRPEFEDTLRGLTE